MALSPSSPLTPTSTCQAYKSECVNELTDFPHQLESWDVRLVEAVAP